MFYFQPSINDETKDVNLVAELILTSKEEINLQSVKCFVNTELFLMFCALGAKGDGTGVWFGKKNRSCVKFERNCLDTDIGGKISI